MLKKKGLFKIFLALVFCFSLFGGNLILNTNKITSAGASSSELTKVSGGDWVFEEGESADTLTLSGAELSGYVNIDKNLNIVLQNNSENKISCDYGAIFSGSNSYTLTISGSGSLELEITDSDEYGYGVFFNGESSAFSQVSFSGFSCSAIIGGAETNIVGTSLNEGNLYGTYYKFTSQSSGSHFSSTPSTYEDPESEGGSPSTGDPEASEHTHSFEYTSSGATLTATCSSSDCNEMASITLNVANIDYGGTPSVTLSRLDDFNSKTSAGLSLSDFTQNFYKTTTEGLTDGGTSVSLSGSPLDAGFYYVTLTSSSESSVGEKTLVCAFKINKVSPGEITGEDKSTTLSAGSYDVSQMFTLPAGTIASYEIVSEGTTGTGTIDRTTLSFTTAGEFKIKCTIAESENYTETSLTKTLLVTTTLEFTVTMNDWDEGQVANSPSISLSDKEATYIYYTDANLTLQTTTEHGAESEGKKPSKAGVYYVQATIEANGIYQESMSSTSFVIWGTPSISVNGTENIVSVKYNTISGGYSLPSLFVFNGTHGNETYYLVNDGEESQLVGSNFGISSLGEYVIKVKTAATDCYKAAECTATLKVEAADFNLETDLVFADSFEYGEQLSATLSGKSYGAEISFEYYSNADCSADNKLDEAPTAVGGPYYVLIKVASTEFSNSAEIKKSYMVTKRIVTEIEWDGPDFTYNGEVQEVHAYYTNVRGNSIALKITFSDEKIFKNADEYQANIDFATEEEKGLYEFSSSLDLFRSYTIAKRVLYIEFGRNDCFLHETETIELNSSIKSGTLISADSPLPYTLSLEGKTPEEYADLTMGQYKIILTVTDSNYDVRYIEEGYFYVKNKITKFEFNSWTYGNTASEPDIEIYYGLNDIKFSYSSDGRTFSETKPTAPGSYVIKAELETDVEYYKVDAAIAEFSINKILVEKPDADKTVFVYNGKEQTYTIKDNIYYTVTGSKQVNAGRYEVLVTLKNPNIYKWDDDSDRNGSIKSYKYTFVINKQTIEKPQVNSKIFKYNGSEQTYFNFTTEDERKYKIVNESENTQIEVGKYTILVGLADVYNTMWSDGTSKELSYEFVINQNSIKTPVAKNSKGEVIENSPVEIIETGESGLAPNVTLNVQVAGSKDDEVTKKYKELIKSQSEHFLKYDKIFAVYSLSLTDGESDVEPQENFTVKLAIPEELENGIFKLYRISKSENGEEKVELFNYIVYNGNIYLSDESVADYVFVYEQESLKSLIVIFSILSGVLLLTLALQLYFLLKKKKKAKRVVKNAILPAAVAPIFYVHSEVVASIVLGVLMCVLALANIAILVLLIVKLCKKRKLKLKEADVELSKPQNKKAKKTIQKDNLVLSETTEENSIENDTKTPKDTKD